jgi:hypothetical protein
MTLTVINALTDIAVFTLANKVPATCSVKSWCHEPHTDHKCVTVDQMCNDLWKTELKVGNVKFLFMNFQWTLLACHYMNILIWTVEIIDLKRITYLVSRVMSLWKMFLRSNIHTLAISPPHPRGTGHPSHNIRSVMAVPAILVHAFDLKGGWYGEGQFQLLHATFLHLQMLASTLIGYKGCV